jgi:hypothetical protein
MIIFSRKGRADKGFLYYTIQSYSLSLSHNFVYPAKTALHSSRYYEDMSKRSHSFFVHVDTQAVAPSLLPSLHLAIFPCQNSDGSHFFTPLPLSRSFMCTMPACLNPPPPPSSCIPYCQGLGPSLL